MTNPVAGRRPRTNAVCSDCHNAFVLTPYRCVTCSSERLNVAELKAARDTIKKVIDERDAALALLPKIRPCVEWARDECETPELRAELTDRLAEIDALLKGSPDAHQ